MNTEPKYPEREFRAKGISAAVWRKTETKNGATYDRFSIKVQKSYRDPLSGEWIKAEMYVFPQEIPQLIAVANKAYLHCTVTEKSEE